MRKVIYGGACSLDGFVAGPNGSLDWLHFSKDVQEVMAKSWASTDTILMGRKTWEGAAGSGGGGSMKGIRSYVFSRTLTSVPGKDVELVTSDEIGLNVHPVLLDGGCVLVTLRGAPPDR